MYRGSLPRPFGPYELLRRLGVGGMAEVYEARRPGLYGVDARVAIKCILPHLTDDPRLVKLFIKEAMLSVRLTHPNVVQVQEFNQVDGIYFLAMELVDGCNLKALMDLLSARREVLPPALASEIALQALAGLHFAHTVTSEDGAPLGIIHRDIKPGNLFLTRQGGVKVGDFGIARARSEMYQTLGQTGTVRGTLGYMAPEQFGEGDLTPAADLFAVGVILFELLSGERLLKVFDVVSVAWETTRLDPTRVVSRLPVPALPLAGVLRRALAPDPAGRYTSAEEMEQDLAAARMQLPPGPPLKVWLTPLWPDLAPTPSTEARRSDPRGPTPLSGPLPGVDDATPNSPSGVLRTPPPAAAASRPSLTELLQDKVAPPAPPSPRRPWGLALGVGLLGALLLHWFSPGSSPSSPPPPQDSTAPPPTAAPPPAPTSPPPLAASSPSPASRVTPTPAPTRKAARPRAPEKAPRAEPSPAPSTPAPPAHAPVIVTVNTIPFGAGRVQIDGGASQKLPMVEKQLAAGSHSFTFSCPGQATTSRTLNLSPDRRHQLVWDCQAGEWFRTTSTNDPATLHQLTSP